MDYPSLITVAKVLGVSASCFSSLQEISHTHRFVLLLDYKPPKQSNYALFTESVRRAIPRELLFVTRSIGITVCDSKYNFKRQFGDKLAGK